ncbi:DeoR/GlpR family DNA-binding transcription regulator [Blastochloris viridis]|uniref:HTH-type transcriptional repressor glcR n=1 Tax=Blastochloris viridis TaxID=1079 RepID=A0A0H5BDV4_BLAVI|nr:DeoR/GlpR family DNA-binding transcription regulator [Blastochloris viridis]ALK10764.1 HTH-type transcriptional repressor GlcR [Blastochloris viridis]BAR99269.1 transcriptional regulator [Blastochloris viridis]CUU43426.1 HTH-type transcriptional repressor glcR [Blastochloris viridis]
MTKLSKKERHERILHELVASSTLRVSELAAELEVSTETIRRDLYELEERGLINRTYGGAVRPLGAEPSASERHRLMVEEREAIAAATVQLIKPKEVVAIGSGATTTHVARRMAAECRDVTVITHAFSVATVLAANPTIQVLICPGRYHGREGMMIGPETLEFLQSYNANWAILGATGVTPEGFCDVDADACAVYRAMMHRAAATIAVVDHTKFDQSALGLWGRWHDVAHLVTDRKPPPALVRAAERARTEITIATRR